MTQTIDYSNEIVEYKGKLAGYEEKANSFICETDEQNEQASAIIKGLSKYKKNMDDRRKFIKSPALETVKRIDGEFQPNIKKAEAIISILKTKVGAFLLKKEQIERVRIKKEQEESLRVQQQEQDRIRKEEAERKALMESAGIENKTAEIEVEAKVASVVAQPVNTEVNLRTESTSARKIYDFEVIDISKIPAEFLLVNESLLKKALNNKEGRLTEVEGIKIIEKMQVRVK